MMTGDVGDLEAGLVGEPEQSEQVGIGGGHVYATKVGLYYFFHLVLQQIGNCIRI